MGGIESFIEPKKKTEKRKLLSVFIYQHVACAVVSGPYGDRLNTCSEEMKRKKEVQKKKVRLQRNAIVTGLMMQNGMNGV